MRARIMLIAFLIITPFTALADDDVAAAQGIIRSQVEALVRKDGAAAYTFPSPALQQMFREPDIFIAMVEKNYAPIQRHKRFEFAEAQLSDGKVAQKVQIVDTEGDPWVALYTLERQPDGTMKITGCTLVKETGA